VFKNSNLYDIDNFVITNYSSNKKIRDNKSTLKEIVIPKYTELDCTYYTKNSKGSSSNVSDDEVVDDSNYLKYHEVYEKREIEYRMNFMKKKKHQVFNSSCTIPSINVDEEVQGLKIRINFEEVMKLG